jgi:hypothetical protein
MKMTSIQRVSVRAGQLVVVCGMFALASGVRAQGMDSVDGPCSNRTLRGDYGFTIEGQILIGPKAGLIRGVVMTHFDGRGNLSQVDHVLDNGAPPPVEWSPAIGTYTVNSDCTGTLQLTFTDGRPPINQKLVVVSQGKQVRTVVSDAGRAITAIGTRVE